MTSAADALVARLPRITLVVGKGGVGKTTAAASLALHSSRTVGPTLVVTTDPARALPDVLGQPIGHERTPIAYAGRLHARVLDAAPLRDRFMARWGSVIRTIIDRGTYLDDSDIGPLVDTVMPGSDEVFSALALAEMVSNRDESSPEERILVDTAPTGHTLRLLALPRTFRALIRLLDVMQAKHRLMVRTLTRTYRRDEADGFLADMTTLVSALETTLRDPAQCAAIVMATDDTLVREESTRLLDALGGLQIGVAAVIWNGTSQNPAPLGAVEHLVVPRLADSPVGDAGLSAWSKALGRTSSARRGPARGVKKRREADTEAAALDFDSLLRSLTIVAGKGGVGKTTVAAALGMVSARSARTLVVSTDPAPSLADVLAQPVPDGDTGIEGVTNLFARQMDASAAFARLRAEYQSRVDALFDGIVAHGVDLSQDRAIVRELLALAPPGIDEVYALSLLSDALFKDRYARVIVDPAPTGHLLRLLEMPKLALSWSHQLMRLMLKYKDIAGLGETAAELLEFSRNLRALDGLLSNAAQSTIIVVTLAEPVVLAETRRLASEAGKRGVRVGAVIVNRTASAPVATLPVPDAAMQLQAPMWTPPPTGPSALADWSREWRTVRA